MKKEIVRREFLKLKLNGHSYLECKSELDKKYQSNYRIRSLKRWYKRFEEGNWNLRDISQRPFKLNYKFPNDEKKLVVDYRKQEGYSANHFIIFNYYKKFFIFL